ncbi:MAG: glutamate formimidoyltransferase, partial [Bacteroidia bacterium]
PYQVMLTSFEGFEVAWAMADMGNPNSLSDAGVGALALHACIEGAWLNVKINSTDVKKHPRVEEILESGRELRKRAEKTKNGILDRVNEKIGP